ncbi:hypothetical protein DES47_101186 [Roseateles toxinivorans]|uniref:Uncharacterized protein n=2 Tax=Roseateles toxinivorans TaxID=270368 RepID=A0A4R6QRL8_9BURK|nr:hypothetical protein DES47_101186 [Roseateles toxinivorans]
MCISAADAATLVGHARELGAGGYGAWLDAWSARMKDRLHELMQQRLIQLQKLAQEKPESVFRLICESVINKGGPLFASTAFRSFDGKERPSYFHDLAVVCLRTLDKEEPKTIDGKYIALSEYVLQEFSLHVYFHRDDLQSYDPDRIMHDAFDQPADSFSEALWRAAELVYHGVPLVRFTADGPQTVIEPDELYVFLSKKGELQDVSSSFTSLPEWTKGLAFELSHLEAHNLMFAAADQLTHVQVLARRSALRRMLALPVPAANGIDGLTLPTHSKLLLLMRQIVDRYYGPNFQIDEVDSWPRQKDVVDWLKAQGLSEREAMAIDIVSRPDRLRSR